MEQRIIGLIAKDRLEMPLSSMYQKIKRSKGKEAKGLAQLLGKIGFNGQRVFAYVREEDREKARGMKEAIAEFSKEFPRYGTILEGKITEKRKLAEMHLYLGINQGCRLTTEDYLGVMQDLGLSENTSRALYPELVKISRKLANIKDEERSILVGKYEEDSCD